MTFFINKLFKKPESLKTVFKRGAIVLDVRMPEEFDRGHIAGAMNIPIDRLEAQIYYLKKKQRPIITCCKSGSRSQRAKAALAAAGIEVYNGGPWDSLQRQIK
jgi:rhodanese-related sulfurtransferase